MKRISYLTIVLPFILLLAGCDEHGDPQADIQLNDTQKASVSMRGQWAQASEATLPFGTTPGILDDLVLTFRIDDSYNPSQFAADGAPYFFEGDNGSWSWTDDTHTAIVLNNIEPVTRIDIMKEGYAIRLSFTYSGPSGGRPKGVGDYGVTLKKIAP